jgi:hypothetical protein
MQTTTFRRYRQLQPEERVIMASCSNSTTSCETGLRWSPEQIALTLAAPYPKGQGYRVSTETIHNCIYDQPVGVLKRELVACLRPGPQQARTAPQTGAVPMRQSMTYDKAERW